MPEVIPNDKLNQPDTEVNSLNNQILKETTKVVINSIVSKIQNAGKNIDTDSHLVIRIDGHVIYKSKVNQEVVENKLDENKLEQIRVALENPQRLENSVSILFGREQVYHASKGEVLMDSLQPISKTQVVEFVGIDEDEEVKLAKSPVKEIEYSEAIKNIEETENSNLENAKDQMVWLEEQIKNSQTLIKSLPDLPSKNDLTVLRRNINEQRETLDIVLEKLEETISRGFVPTQNIKGEWVAEIAVGKALAIQNQAKNVFTPQVEELEKQINDKFAILESKLGIDDSTKQEIRKIVEALKGKDLVKLASEMLSMIGERNTQNNALQYASNYYLFSEKEGELKVFCKNGRGEILNNEGWTEQATVNDMKRLRKLEEVVSQLRVKNPVISPSLKP